MEQNSIDTDKEISKLEELEKRIEKLASEIYYIKRKNTTMR
jgi:hypothetical protein